MKFVICILAICFACFAVNENAVAQSVSASEIKKREAIVKGVDVFVKRFVKHGADLSTEMIVDCSLTTQLLVRSAILEHKKGKLNDMILLSMSSEQRAWSALFKQRKAGGANMNVGEAVKFFETTNGPLGKEKARNYFVSKSKECTQTVETVQKNGLSQNLGG